MPAAEQLRLIALDPEDLLGDLGACAGRPRPGLRHRLAAGRKAPGGRDVQARLGADLVGRNRPAPADRSASVRPGAGLQVPQHRPRTRRTRCWNWSESNSTPLSAPGGSALLLFNHGGALRLDVECLECELTDLGGDDDLGTSDSGCGIVGAGGLKSLSSRRRPGPISLNCDPDFGPNPTSSAYGSYGPSPGRRICKRRWG